MSKMSTSRPSRLSFVLLAALVLGGILAIQRSGPPAARPTAPRPSLPRPVATAATVAGAAGAVPAATAPAWGANQLLAFVQTADAARLTAALRPPASVVRYVRINRELVEGKASPFWQPGVTGRLELPLADGGSATVVIESSESLGVRRFTSVGSLAGRPESRVVFAYNEGFLHGHIEDPDLGTYELRAASDEVEQYYKVDPELLKACGGTLRPVIDAEAIAEVERRRQAASSLTPAVSDGSTEDRPAEAATVGANVRIDLMMLYTQAVLSTMTGDARTSAIQSACDAGVAQLNDDLARSLTQSRVRLVRIAQTTYAGDELTADAANWQSTLLTRVSGATDGFMDEIHALRDSSGADLVCLLQQRFDTQSAGIAWTMTVGEFDHATNPLYGFSVVQYNYMTVEHVFAHEVGHNLGCTHNREDSSSQAAYPYSYGYRFTAANGTRYRDIMSYDTSPGYRFLAYFSTPLVTPIDRGVSIGSPVGITAGLSGESDCSRTIDQVAFEVSQFRLQQQAPANTGTLYAVSTRAFVGTASEQQLIGAFIVSGSAGTTKRMLLRGNGPSLASAGITNYLPNPKLTLFRLDGGTRTIAENDNWETQVTVDASYPAGSANAIATAGGTSAATGSRDAALLVDLPPGTYSANVTSADGSTGVALVEAYEVTAAGTRITALSTRGYSATATPMIAGFIVSGSAGTTKRIVIRGQGPSMTGLNGAMTDPYLELYNSTSDLVMVNDDWAAQNVTFASPDTQPRAVYYSELQIQAAGMAPANRREPVLMVDLAPGVYTAILKPYQTSLTVAGSPGVALIEVYEVP
jgi:hypothetical protein